MRSPGNLLRIAFEEAERAQKVPRFAAPAAADFEVLPVDVPVSVDGARAHVRVVTRDHIAASVANEREALFDRSRGTRSFDGDVGTLAVCQFAYGRCSRFDACRRDVEDDIGSHRSAERQPLAAVHRSARSSTPRRGARVRRR